MFHRTKIAAGATAFAVPLVAFAAAPSPAIAAGLLETLEQKGGFETLTTALQNSDATWITEEDVTYTLFAPTDEAFQKLPEGALDALLDPENKTELTVLLEHHAVPERALKGEEIEDGQQLDPAEGEPLQVSATDGQVRVGDATVVETDIQTDTGVVHAIDSVLVPEIVREAMREQLGGGQ